MTVQAKSPSGRVEWLDYARGIGIILVVLGHVIYGARTDVVGPPLNAYLFLIDLIYSFHMPLFFFASGALFRRRTQVSIVQFARSSFIGLIVPYVVWTVAFVALQHVHSEGVHHPYPFADLLSIWRRPIAHMWFIYALFVLQIAFYLGFQIAGAVGILAVGCIFALSYLMDLGLSFANIAMGGTFFVLGYLCTSESVLAEWRQSRWGFMAAGAFVWAASIAYNMPVTEHAKATPVAALAGVLMTVSACLALPRARGPCAILAMLGQASIAIYVAHTIFAASLRILLYKLQVFNYDFHILSETLFGLAAPTALYIVANRLAISPIIGFGPTRQIPYRAIALPKSIP
jgi:fucose 4-O-acetylase-like acetyltransferase